MLIRLVRRAIDDDRYPIAPRLDPLKALLAKLDPPKPQPEPVRPLPPAGGTEPRPLLATPMKRAPRRPPSPPTRTSIVEAALRLLPTYHGGQSRMTHVLSAVAMSMAIVVAVPAWAQGAGPSPHGTHHVESSAYRAAKTHGHVRPHHAAHARTASARAPEGSTADQLNRQELGTLQGSATATGRGFGPKASGGNYIPPQE